VPGVTLTLCRRPKGLQALDLTRAIFEWHEGVYGWTAPSYYGQALDRIVHFADFAIWAAWLKSR
jgi:hypothetical protein